MLTDLIIGTQCPYHHYSRVTIFLLQRRLPSPVPGSGKGLCPAEATRRNRDGVDRSHCYSNLPSHPSAEGHQQPCHVSPLDPGPVRGGIQILPRLLRRPSVTSREHGLAHRYGNVGGVGVQRYSDVLPSILSE